MRAPAAFVLLFLGALLVPVATAGWWAHGAVVPVQGYVDTVAPLATDKAVVAEVEDRLVSATMTRVEASSASANQQVEPLVRLAVGRAVHDPSFAQAWRSSNRVVHRQLVEILSGDSPAVTAGPGSTVSVDLAPLTSALRAQLVTAGVPFAAQLPTVEATLPLIRSRDLDRAQGGYTFVDRWGPVLPFVALALVVLGALVARRRLRALAWTGLASLVGLGALAVALVLGRDAFHSVVPGSVPTPVANAVFDTVATGLWHDLLVVVVGAVVVTVVASVADRVSLAR